MVISKKQHKNLPSETWNKTGSANKAETTFLELDIKINNKKVSNNSLWWETLLSFFSKKLPYLHSNMPSRIFYSSIDAERLKIGKANNTNSHFIMPLKLFFTSIFMCQLVSYRLQVTIILNELIFFM